MYKSLITKAAAIAVAVTFGAAAHAATTIKIVDASDPLVAADVSVSAGNGAVVNEFLIATGGVDSTTFTVTADTNLVFTSLLLEASGFNSGADIAAVEITFTAPGGFSQTVDFTPDGPPSGTLAQGSAVFAPPPFAISQGEAITFTVSEKAGESIVSTVALDLLVTTAAVPVPAAGVLMLGLMAAGGFTAHRRNREKTTA